MGRRRGASTAQADEIKVVDRWTGSNSSEAKPREVVVRTADEWKGIWQQVHANSKPVPALPAVDFTKHMVVAAFAGRKNNTGYRIDVARFDRRKDDLVVDLLERTPNPDKLYGQAVTSPFVLAVIPKDAGKVSFGQRPGRRLTARPPGGRGGRPRRYLGSFFFAPPGPF